MNDFDIFDLNVLEVEILLALKFDPNQPRDDSGRWSDTGADNGGSGGDSGGGNDNESSGNGGDKATRDSVEAYISEDYRNVNNYLRGGSDAVSSSDIPGIEKAVKHMDSAIAKSTLSKDTTVFRGVSGDIFDELSEGDTFQDDGFISTSSNDVYAENFSIGGFGASNLVTIHIPKGAHGLWVNDVLEVGREENELILPRGSKFKIQSIESSGRNRWIDVEVIQ